MTALILFAHGSPVASANDGVRELAEAAGRAGGYDLAAHAFLDPVEPGLPAAVASVVARGARRVVVVPYFLTVGLHLRRDVPRIAGALRDIYPGVRIDVTAPLEGHPALVDIVLDRAKQHGGSGPESPAD